MEYAPVVLFVYNRPKHTNLTLEALKNNVLADETILYVYHDGLKQDDKANEQKHKEVKEIINSIEGFKQVVIVERETNYGLAKSVIQGVTEVLNEHNKAIILEDDLVCSKFFLQFMNDGLEMYEASSNVYSIQGYMFPVEVKGKNELLLPFTSTWGWSTWKDKWACLELELKQKDIIKNNKYLSQRFNLGDYKYTDMLDFGNNSWGIKWYYSVFRRNGLCVYPPKSLVQNIGFDGSGTNCETNNSLIPKLNEDKIALTKQEFIDIETLERIEHYFTIPNSSILKKIINKIRQVGYE